jgi:hypothetical protein
MCINKQFQIPLSKYKCRSPPGYRYRFQITIYYIFYSIWTLLEYEREISFANSLVRLKRLSPISLTYNRKSSGPSTEPGGLLHLYLLRGIWNCLLKTKAMVFSNINLPNGIEITFQDKLVEFVTCHKHLGITFRPASIWSFSKLSESC